MLLNLSFIPSTTSLSPCTYRSTCWALRCLHETSGAWPKCRVHQTSRTSVIVYQVRYVPPLHTTACRKGRPILTCKGFPRLWPEVHVGNDGRIWRVHGFPSLGRELRSICWFLRFPRVVVGREKKRRPFSTLPPPYVGSGNANWIVVLLGSWGGYQRNQSVVWIPATSVNHIKSSGEKWIVTSPVVSTTWKFGLRKEKFEIIYFLIFSIGKLELWIPKLLLKSSEIVGFAKTKKNRPSSFELENAF